jgi:hypothetical protein
MGFSSPCAVRFGDAAATNVSVASAAELRATTTPRMAGPVPVIVTCGNAAGQLANGFTFVQGRNRAVRH